MLCGLRVIPAEFRAGAQAVRASRYSRQMTKPEPKKEEDVSALATDETANWQEIYERLNLAADAENPPAWLPETEGEELFGQVVGVNPAVPTKFGSAPVVTIRKPNDELVSLWLLHTVLRREFLRAEPKIDEYVLVRYQGRVTPEGGGGAYASYAVLVEREEKGLDWKAIGERYGGDVDMEQGLVRNEEGDAALASGTPPADDDIPFMPTGYCGL